MVTDPGSGGASESFRVRLVTRARFTVQRKKKNGTWVEVQHLTRDVNAGSNTVRLTGRALGKPLKPGFYRLRIKAQGVLSKGSDPLTAKFRIG